MSIVKEYKSEQTKIRIHDDFINSADVNEIKNIIISLIINTLKNDEE